MESILEAKKGKSNLAVGSDLYYHDKNEFTTDKFPKIVPLYDGQELNINQKLIMNGLATISIRNMRSTKCPIKVKLFKKHVEEIIKRNSFFNLHRPELKGLNIEPTENQQEKMLQQHIIKEVKTIHEIKSMKSLCKINGPQSLSVNSEANNLENNIKSTTKLLTDKHFIKILKPIETTTFVQQQKLLDSYDMDPETFIQPTDTLCVHDEELKSTLID